MNALPLAFVYHANQFVITNGYADRDGIDAVTVGFDAVLSLHVTLGIPASLHISGPLLEAMAWHRPAALRRLRTQLETGLITLVGGTYGENIMPFSSPAMNRRQLRAYHELVEELLQVPRQALRTAWVPERVWDTSACAPPLLDEAATGVRYRRVLLDDRLCAPLSDGQYQHSARAAFDARGPYGWHERGFPSSTRGLLETEALRPYRIAGAEGLTAVPLASHLRYLIPPHCPSHLDLLAELVNFGAVPPAPEGSLLVFADDLERVAGVAGWEAGLERHHELLTWLVAERSCKVVALDDWCDGVAADDEVDVEPGTYYELAHRHGAGEDYRRWAEDERWEPYARLLRRVEHSLCAAEADGADPGLCWLAERVLMLGHHETAWQDPDPGAPHGRAPAPWARATAAHCADALAVLEAARWVNHPAGPGPRVQLRDIDGDGEDEIIVSNDWLFAVLSPVNGGRLTLLVHRQIARDGSPRGVVVVGNPADHWNFQEELHRYMEQPPNHPGALGVEGTETHAYDVTDIELDGGMAVVEVIDRCPGRDFGLTKRISLSAGSEALVVCVQRPGLPGELRTWVALSPDYAELLRGGRTRVRLRQGWSWTGATTVGTTAWVAHDPATDTALFHDASPTTGHAHVCGVEGSGNHLHLVLGAGESDLSRIPGLIRTAESFLHKTVVEPPTVVGVP